MTGSKRFSTALISILGLGLLTNVLMSSCNSTGCTDNRSSLPLAGFYDSKGQAIAIDSLEIYGIGAPDDSVLYPSSRSLSEAYLPLRATGENLGYVFHYVNAGLSDTVHFDFDAFPYFASEECGAMYRYRLRGVDYTRTLIDSIAVLDSLITNVPKQQLHIYFRTSGEPTR